MGRSGKMKLRKIISGGQTGADQAGLGAALHLGLATGGWVPRGWRTDTGAEPDLAKLGLREHESSQYPPRTGANIAMADGTLVFGDPTSPGCRLTIRIARQAGSPLFICRWQSNAPLPDAHEFAAWLREHEVEVLNVAGNRERLNPGIFRVCRQFVFNGVLLNAFREIDAAST